MTDAATLNATARVRQLTDLTTRLTDRLSEESRAFEARRPQDVAATLSGTQELANAYRRESAQLKANPASVAAAPAADRMALIRATEAFEAMLSGHARAVEAARIVSEGLVRTIAAEVAGQRGSPSAYGASGKANAGDGRAVAFNRQA
ncbi:MAG: flagellar basal-body protein FlbY [Brevundimonas sp.]|uniref:flagellar basal-body protein FlbY n=1 Tax=Brevundimonas sp. TaxID=1871086 RepID=UPI0027202653|nr:flagellar basal-body protein FlbY [Brevundimonas sp.]MDO9589390.1 flagellar basal-body protein FlbY [Brevundimonas sp.]MDP3370179.1 flagellar basal-body protein FlbY [Brevundimonas sp.]MDP3657093.1 flagellar basal-body protein FlbY [Brevundimonas sp.]MDZ4060137.1 flagellar basal-body protein FlbY [Brevundimonas sp.]